MKPAPPIFATDFRVLSEAACHQIHLASLQILEDTGVHFHDDRSVEFLKSKGLDVSDENCVRFQPQLVEWAIRNTPPRVTLWDRNGNPSVRLQERNVYFGTGSDCPYIQDSFTGQRRKFLKKDVEQGIRICDYLPNIDFVLSMGLISDVDESVSDLHQFDAMIRNTDKPVVFTAHDLDNCRTIVEMAELVAGGGEALRRRPQILLFTETVSPLQYGAETAQKLLYMAEKKLPVVLNSGPMMGASGPQTHAGVLALANAEVLAGIVMAQLAQTGTPIVYALGIHPLDMRTTVLPYGAPELSLNNAATADMARYYDLPVWGYAGCSDAKVVDEQAAVEATSSVIMSLLAGNHLVHDVGYLESGLTSSFEMLILTDTIIAMSRHLFKPIEINAETLALDVIARVGAGGHYMNQEHTLKHFREIFYHDLVDRKGVEDWAADGSLTMKERLNQKVREVLETHLPGGLPEEVAAHLAHLLAQAEEEKINSQMLPTT